MRKLFGILLLALLPGLASRTAQAQVYVPRPPVITQPPIYTSPGYIYARKKALHKAIRQRAAQRKKQAAAAAAAARRSKSRKAAVKRNH